MEGQKPSVGRVVHYFPPLEDREARANGNDGPLAAIITRVWSDTGVNLTVFPDFAFPIARSSVFKRSPGATGPSPSGDWDWPERV